MSTLKTHSILALGSLLLVCLSSLSAAEPRGKLPIPDFTRGESIPRGATHDWNLGATGARGWIYRDRLTTTDARQIRVTEVEPKSPAASVLEVGDVILGVGGKTFDADPRALFGRAFTKAESEEHRD